MQRGLLSIANGISRPQTVERATTTVAHSPAPGLAQRASLPLSPRVPRALVSPLPPSHLPSLNQSIVRDGALQLDPSSPGFSLRRCAGFSNLHIHFSPVSIDRDLLVFCEFLLSTSHDDLPFSAAVSGVQVLACSPEVNPSCPPIAPIIRRVTPLRPSTLTPPPARAALSFSFSNLQGQPPLAVLMRRHLSTTISHHLFPPLPPSPSIPAPLSSSRSLRCSALSPREQIISSPRNRPDLESEGEGFSLDGYMRVALQLLADQVSGSAVTILNVSLARDYLCSIT